MVRPSLWTWGLGILEKLSCPEIMQRRFHVQVVQLMQETILGGEPH